MFISPLPPQNNMMVDGAVNVNFEMYSVCE